jgi:hypothetical protein
MVRSQPSSTIRKAHKPIIVVTRLRPRARPSSMSCFTDAATVLEQAQRSKGNLGTTALAEAHDVWWSVTGHAPLTQVGEVSELSAPTGGVAAS